MKTLTLNIQPRGRPLALQVRADTQPLALTIRQGHSIDWYTGSYEVTPTFFEQTLPTEDKTMREDVAVHAIPVEVVTNPSGGNTVTIGG